MDGRSRNGRGVWEWAARAGPEHPRLVAAIGICVALVFLLGAGSAAVLAINDRASKTGSNSTGPIVGLVLMTIVALAIAIPVYARRGLGKSPSGTSPSRGGIEHHEPPERPHDG